jgi:hypothetical protein
MQMSWLVRNVGCKRRRLRFEHMQQRHLGMKLLAYTLINARECCGA